MVNVQHFMGMCELELKEARINAVFCEEGGVRPRLGDAPVIEHEDGIGIGDGGEAMGDDERGASVHEAGEGLLDEGI